jgi:histidine ammonia-lyase
VLGIEVLTAARALDLRAPLSPSPATGAVRDLLRSRGIPGPGPDTYLSPDLETAAEAVGSGAVARTALEGAHA